MRLYAHRYGESQKLTCLRIAERWRFPAAACRAPTVLVGG